MSVLEIPSKLSPEEDMFKAYLENLYTTKLQEGIQIMLNYLLGTRHWQDTTATPEHAQNFHISNMSAPELPSKISSPEEIYQTSLMRFYAIIGRLETMLIYPRAPLQISNIPKQPKEIYGYHYPINWYHVVRINDVEQYGLSEITK